MDGRLADRFGLHSVDYQTLLGAYGNCEVKTPNTDQLAKEGVRYTHPYHVAGVFPPEPA